MIKIKKGQKERRRRNDWNSKKDRWKKKNKKNNTRASLDQVATLSHLVKIRGLP
jgi:hypothetical protein